MKVDDNHLLQDAVPHLLPGGREMKVRRCVVIHYTEGGAGSTSIDWWKRPQNRENDLGAHLVIERDGTIIQCRPFNRTISHAGTSRWREPGSGKLFTMCNGFSIGIELANAGSAVGRIKGVSKLPGFAGTKDAIHANGGKLLTWEIYPEAQVAACIEVCRALVARYKLDDITGHDCIAPERKTDPGPVFPMGRVRDACGFVGLPVVHRP